jgi:hypothetical protein
MTLENQIRGLAVSRGVSVRERAPDCRAADQFLEAAKITALRTGGRTWRSIASIALHSDCQSHGATLSRPRRRSVSVALDLIQERCALDFSLARSI